MFMSVEQLEIEKNRVENHVRFKHFYVYHLPSFVDDLVRRPTNHIRNNTIPHVESIRI